jgi:hypothetical protein
MFAQSLPSWGGVTNSVAGMTSFVPMKMNGDALTDLLMYNVNTGVAAYAVSPTATPGKFVYPPPSPGVIVNALPGFTTIIPINLDNDANGFTDLLSYNATTGMMTLSIGGGPGIQTTLFSYNQGDCRDICAQGWTSIVPMNLNNDSLTDLLFYNATTGLSVFAVGAMSEPPTMVAAVSAATGWTSVVPMNIDNDVGGLTDLLSYNAVTGLAVYSKGVGNPASQQVVATVNAVAGSTTITPLDLNGDSLTDLLSYNAATGMGYYSIGLSSGAQQLVTSPAQPQQGSARWLAIVPMTLQSNEPHGPKDLFFYQ